MAVDIHCHIFNAKDLPVAGFLRRWLRTNLALVLQGIPVTRPLAEQLAEIAVVPLVPVLVFFQASLQSIAPGAGEDFEGAPGNGRPYTAQELMEMLRPEVDRVAREELEKLRTNEKANERTRGLAARMADPQVASLAEVLTTLRVEEQSGFSTLLGIIEQDASTAAPLGMKALSEPREGEEKAVATRRYDKLLLKWISDRLNFFAVGMHSRKSIGREVARTYPAVELLVPALVDFDEWIDAVPFIGLTRAPVTPAAQVLMLEQLSRLSMKGRLTGEPEGKQRLHGYVAYCPAREITLTKDVYPKVPAADSSWAGPDTTYREEVEPIGDWPQAGPEHVQPQPSFRLVRHAIERAGFVGVKLYPPVGFRPLGNEELFDSGAAEPEHRGARLDNALCRLYSWCQEKQVPVMAHCGVTNSFSLAAMECPHPAHWEKVLARYPNLRLCFGHLGHGEGLPKRPSNGYKPEQVEKGWAAHVARLMQKYEHVYADIANFDMSGAEPHVEAGDIEVLRHLMRTYDRFSKRLIYGSDWFMNNLLGEHDRYYERLYAGLGHIFKEEAGYEASSVFRMNAMRFLFGEDQSNLNRQRLLTYYRAANALAPVWLEAA